MSSSNTWAYSSYAVGAVLIASAIIGCDPASATNDCSATYPSAPEGNGPIVHVAPCGGPNADGSATKPYQTISAAVDALRNNAEASKYMGRVLVAPGTYTENLLLDSGFKLHIVGADKPASHEDAAIILQSPNPHAVVVKNGSTVTLEGIRVENSAGVGVWANEGSSVTVVSSSIDGVSADGEGIGYGLLATDDSAIILQRSEVTGAAVMGMLVHQSRAIILQSSIHDNQGAGLRVEQSTEAIQIEASEFLANTQSAVALLNSRAIILQSKLSGTLPDASGVADGLLATELSGVDANAFPTELEVRESDLSGNGRSGLLASGAATRTIILQNNTISGNGATATMGAGVWMQGGAGSSTDSIIDGNTLSQNRFMGLCMRGDTHGIILQNNMITGTALGSAFSGIENIQLGDGIHLLAGASAQIKNNDISSNGRLGLILDNALGPGTVIQGNTFASNGEYGVAVQSTMSAPSTTGNTFNNNTLGDNASSPNYAVPAVDLAAP